MKRKVSDLLDSIQEDSLELHETTPLDPDRIRQRTLKKCGQKEKEPRAGRRIVFRVAVAAAVLALLPATVFAAERLFGAGDWFRQRFNEKLEEDRQFAQQESLDVTIQETVSQSQVDIANALGQSFQEQSVTVKGTTMTMKAAYADERVLHAYIQVETPEGVILPDNCLYSFTDREGEETPPITVAPGQAYRDFYGYTIQVAALKDENPNDNLKNFDLSIWSQLGQEGKFNDGVSKQLHLTGLFRQVLDQQGDEDGMEPFAEGDFTFDIGLVNQAPVLDVDVTKAQYGGHQENTWSHEGDCLPVCPTVPGETDPATGRPLHREEFDYWVEPQSLKISPLTVQSQVAYTCSQEGRGFGLAFRIVMKDGTTPQMESGGSVDAEGSSLDMRIFTTPIDPSQIDYILIGDDSQVHRIDLP